MSHTINYEHKVKDQIFFMHKNKITEGEIEEIQITVKKSQSQFANSVARIIYQIRYTEDSVINTILKPCEYVFATKQELLDSL